MTTTLDTSILKLYQDHFYILRTSSATHGEKGLVAFDFQQSCIQNDWILRTEDDVMTYDIIVILKSPDLQTDPLLQFLKSIVGSFQSQHKKIIVLNYHPQNPHLSQQQINKLNNKVIIAFGITPAELFIPQQVQVYLEFVHTNKSIFLLSDTLNIIHTNTDNKKKLWMGIKKIFGV